ncbi:MAG: hypothetical protein M3126_06735 [Candidatus Eremiobacteraeota bacterium]|nr:hypothetical protein [Candidatus Eremiobacteraeota bacterium]
MNPPRMWVRPLVIVALVAAMLTGTLRPSFAFLDKTRFVAHLGVAYFCFHHWVWNPYREGKFSNGADHRTSSIVKAGVASLFAYHEVKVAEKIAQKSKSPLLQKISGGLSNLDAQFASVGGRLKSGHFDPKDIENLNGVTSSVASDAASNGAAIKDVPVALPGQ